MVGKLKSVPEVVRTIPSGSHIALGGFAIARNTIAVVHELIRQRKADLTISQGVVGLDTGFPLHIPKEIPATPLPTAEELRLLREELDPQGVHLK